MSRQSMCPRCGDKLLVERDEYGWYEECIMCGYTHDLAELVTVRQRNDKDSKETLAEVSS